MTPVSIEYECGMVDVSNSLLYDYVVVLLLCCCVSRTIATCKVYDVFHPNQYMYNKFAKEGKHKWQVYAEAVREVLMKETGMKRCDTSFNEVAQYWKYMSK